MVVMLALASTLAWGGTPALNPLELLRPSEVDVASVQPAVDGGSVAALRAVEGDIEASLRAAKARRDDLRRLTKVAALAGRLAATEVRARRVDLTAARQGERVQRLRATPPADGAVYEVARSREALLAAHATADLARMELLLLREHAAHAATVRDLERARLAEARARADSPPASQAELLRRQAVRSHREVAEAKRRSQVLLTEARARAASDAISSEPSP